LEAESFVAAPLEDVFEFFSKAENLERITPPNLNFKILTKLPIKMENGTKIDYQLRLLGISFRWQSLISDWKPPLIFVDEQVRGPYKLWHHEHRFESSGEGTKVFDRVQYRVLGGLFEPIIHAIFVGPQLKRIFAFRRRVIQSVFLT
jgi:ligand-binding SRPBCC domain-containing protein